MGKKISREKLARAIKERSDLFPITKNKKLTLQNLVEILDGIPVLIQEHLAKGENVHWRGLGSFQVVERKSRLYNDPRTKEKKMIPSRKSVRVTPSDSLKKKLNKIKGDK